MKKHGYKQEKQKCVLMKAFYSQADTVPLIKSKPGMNFIFMKDIQVRKVWRFLNKVWKKLNKRN